MNSSEPDPPDPPKEPSARTKRREANKKYDEYVIKTGLDKLCLLQGSQKQAFMVEISKRVESISKGVHRLSICMNLHVRDALKTQLAQNNYDYSKVNIDMFATNDTFARQFMTNSGVNLHARIIDISNRYSEVIPALPLRCLLDMNTVTFACSLFNTNWKNHIEFNFSHYQKKWAQIFVKEHFKPPCPQHPPLVIYKTTVYQRHIKFLINCNETDTSETDLRAITMCRSNPDVMKIIRYHRKVLGRTGENKPIKLEDKLRYLCFLDSIFAKRKLNRISVVPLATFKAHFMYIDMSVLYGILKSIGVINCNLVTFKELAPDHWSSIFKLSALLTCKQRSTCHFSGVIQTDGVSACIHYKRLKSKDALQRMEEIETEKARCKEQGVKYNAKRVKKPQLCKEPANVEDERIIGNDPGRANIACTAELVGAKWVHTRLSRKQYYTDSGILDARKCTNRWVKEIQTKLDQLSKTTHKGTGLNSFIEYLDIVNTYYDDLWNEYLKRRHSRQRFRIYSGKQSVLEKYAESFKDGSDKPIVFAYGSAGFDSTSKYEMSVPKSRIYRVLERKYRIVDVDEFRTTQYHHATRSRLAKVYDSSGKRIIRGLLWCSSTNECKFINRDSNAAKNIHLCYSLKERPELLRRTNDSFGEPPKVKKLPQIDNNEMSSGSKEQVLDITRLNPELSLIMDVFGSLFKVSHNIFV
jgi:hypothetical protein